MAKKTYKKNVGQQGVFSYYAKRINDKKLTKGQRGYALGRVKEMQKQSDMHKYKQTNQLLNEILGQGIKRNKKANDLIMKSKKR